MKPKPLKIGDCVRMPSGDTLVIQGEEVCVADGMRRWVAVQHPCGRWEWISEGVAREMLVR